LLTLTGQFVDKPTRGQSIRRLVNSRTKTYSQLTDSEFFNDGKIVINVFQYVYTKQHRPTQIIFAAITYCKF